MILDLTTGRELTLEECAAQLEATARGISTPVETDDPLELAAAQLFHADMLIEGLVGERDAARSDCDAAYRLMAAQQHCLETGAGVRTLI